MFVVLQVVGSMVESISGREMNLDRGSWMLIGEANIHADLVRGRLM